VNYDSVHISPTLRNYQWSSLQIPWSIWW